MILAVVIVLLVAIAASGALLYRSVRTLATVFDDLST